MAAAFYVVTHMNSGNTGGSTDNSVDYNRPLFHHKPENEKDMERGLSGAAHFFIARFGALRNKKAQQKFQLEVADRVFGGYTNDAYSGGYFGHVVATIAVLLSSAKVELSTDKEYLVFRASVPANIHGQYWSENPFNTKDHGKGEHADNWQEGKKEFAGTVQINFLGLCYNGYHEKGVIPSEIACTAQTKTSAVYRANNTVSAPNNYWKRSLEAIYISRLKSAFAGNWRHLVLYREDSVANTLRSAWKHKLLPKPSNSDVMEALKKQAEEDD